MNTPIGVLEGRRGWRKRTLDLSARRPRSPSNVKVGNDVSIRRDFIERYALAVAKKIDV